MFNSKWLIFVFAVFLLLAQNASAEDDDQDANGLKVPRFVSLRSGEVNMRIGPGTRYGINWVYRREGLPVEILQEFDQWREIRDAEGTKGWVHKQMLQGKRMGEIVGGIGVLRRSPEEHGGPIIRAEPGVVGKLLECEKDWCRLQIAGRKGWIEKTHIWGVYSNEEF
jgi:SH3-like domain-containing protein